MSYLYYIEVPFELQHHRTAFTAQDVANSEHISNKEMTKVVIVTVDGTMSMLVSHASHRVDMLKLRDILGAQEVRLSMEEELSQVFSDCGVGAMPPFGRMYDLPVYVDPALAKDETIVFQAGTHTDTMRVKYQDFARLVKPTIADNG
ncbi:MAG: YbaK/EbsC family protein [Chloroflexi bacterium AL-W]|nr:YbaK/EbsC family protein [Chloroflexi bacterium AL-N1]NOK68008.1 YbaK/EbsC family protein [Chloroflexi bacterium AL-N10]NOK73348.1 YbaK/EbsC family protein [Chloroflexi bacterium AL-N5]NOK83262.1 YbaK/EbsC family protein [Chloroflexi bacterium AL-W]NOK87679.1 YbaK/EbsC family protein [Chloroflexi bacterium AL-N15]